MVAKRHSYLGSHLSDKFSRIEFVVVAGRWTLKRSCRTDAVGPGRLAALMDRLAESFDWIIIDGTPILPVADTSVWARLSHGIIMIVREAKSEKDNCRKRSTRLTAPI